MVLELVSKIIWKVRDLKILCLRRFIGPLVILSSKLKGIKITWDSKFYGWPILHRSPNSTIRIGRNVTLRSDRTSNLFGTLKKTTIATLTNGAILTIGDNCGISAASITCYRKVLIGNNVLIGANVFITDSDWHGILVDHRNELGISKDVIISDNVWIGANSIVLKGVSVGRGSVIGAGSVVTKNIPDNVIAAGNPCVVLKKIENGK